MMGFGDEEEEDLGPVGATTSFDQVVKPEPDDYEYYNYSGRLVRVRPSRFAQMERRLLLRAGL